MRRFGDCTKNDALTADSAPDTKQLCDWCALPLARPMPHETDEMVAALKNCRSYLTNFGSINPSELVQQIDDALATVELREANAIIGSEK